MRWMDVAMCLDDLYKNAHEGNTRAQSLVDLGAETHPERAYRGFRTWWDELFRGEESNEDGARIRELWEEMVQRLNPAWKSEREKKTRDSRDGVEFIELATGGSSRSGGTGAEVHKVSNAEASKMRRVRLPDIWTV
jgi:hypothetical protein